MLIKLTYYNNKDYHNLIELNDKEAENIISKLKELKHITNIEIIRKEQNKSI